MWYFDHISPDDAGDYHCKAEYAQSGDFSGGSLTSNSATLVVISTLFHNFISSYTTIKFKSYFYYLHSLPNINQFIPD